jgi:hypothetical protein
MDIKTNLQFGDVTRIATECNVTAATVQRAIRGIGAPETVKLITDVAKLMIKQRADRRALLLKRLNEQRKTN